MDAMQTLLESPASAICQTTIDSISEFAEGRPLANEIAVPAP
jgi:hypothetical protein